MTDPTAEQLLAEVRALSDKLDAPGWPRPRLSGRPVPWVLGSNVLAAGWTAMQPDRVRAGYGPERACVVCGLRMEGAVVLGRYFGASPDDSAAKFRLTDGPPGHPRCILLAARTCPHLAREGERTPAASPVVAYYYDGRPPIGVPVPLSGKLSTMYLINPRATDLTLPELRALARRSPLG